MATFISLAAYGAAAVVGLTSGFQYTLFVVAVIQITWTLFCAIRLIQLRRAGSHRPDALASDRESYRFALGGSISSVCLFLAVVVLTQVV